MHLGDGGGRDGFRELGKHLVHRAAQFFLDHLARHIRGEGWQLVLQILQLVGQFGTDHVGAGRQDLTELDVGRTPAR